MIKKELYKKTIRINDDEKKVTLTEKIDGANIGFFRIEDELLIVKKSEIYTLFEFKELMVEMNGENKRLSNWLTLYGEELKNSLHNGSGFFGEFLTKKHIKYPSFKNKIHMFAKANLEISDEIKLSNVFYDHSLFKFPFIQEEIPDFISVVPIVAELDYYPTVKDLDNIYKTYCKQVNRKVEGFVVEFHDMIRKYVRYKNGKFTKHKVK